MYTLVVIMCHFYAGEDRAVCKEVPIVKGYQTINACEDARINGKGTHSEAVLYRCKQESK